jgi:hypothetical protein
MIINNMYGHFFRLRRYRNDYTIHNYFFLKNTNIDCTKVPSVVIVLSVKALLGTTDFLD